MANSRLTSQASVAWQTTHLRLEGAEHQDFRRLIHPVVSMDSGLQVSSDAKLLFARLLDRVDGEQDILNLENRP